MSCTKLAQLGLLSFRSLLILIVTTVTAAAAPQAPSNVSALLYSNTAAELFWTRSDGQSVRIQRNDQLLGVYDGGSLFQSGLDSSQQYRYLLQSVNSNGEVSQSWQIDIAPGAFSPPIKKITAQLGSEPASPIALNGAAAVDQPEAQAEPEPTPETQNVSALLYSNTAAELFWTSGAGQRVRIQRNDQLLGFYDGGSLFQSGLDSSQQYRYLLQSVNSNGEVSQSWQIDIAPGAFSPPIKKITAQLGSEPASPINLNDVAAVDQPEAQAELAPTPEPQAETQPIQQPEAIAEAISPSSNPTSGCEVRNLNDLSNCINSNDSTVTVLNDLACSGGDCCPSGRALVNIQSKQNLTIDGNGHKLLRSSDQRSCMLVDINAASNITLRNWQLDDDINVAGCQVTDRCPRTLQIWKSNNVQLENMHISNGKSYAIYVHEVNGFAFRNSSLTNSGVLGLYVGDGDSSPSRGVVIENSTFRDNQTSGLAFRGVTGSQLGENRVTNNLFIRNHRLGQWRVAAQYGEGFTNGGQVYIAQASYVDFDNNQILDGYCANCFVQSRTRSGASGLELGLVGEASVSHLRVRNNIISNHDAWGISHNSNSVLTDVLLQNNTLINNTTGDRTQGGVTKLGMTVSDTEFFDSFESNSGFQTDTHGSSGASAQRQCGVASLDGSCVMRLSLAGNDSDSSAASVSGDWKSVAEFRQVFLNGWLNRVVGEADGQWCLEFANSDRDVINSQCKSLSEADRSSVQAFVGSPSLDAVSPISSRYVRYRVTLNGAHSTLDVDDIKLSID